MRLKFTGAVFVILMPFTVFMFSRAELTSRENPSGDRQADLLEKLSIEPVQETPAPDFSLKDLEGNSFRLRKLRGKVVLLNFWATWCPPCRFEMPSMESLNKEFSGQGLVILAVNFQESAEAVGSFYQQHNLSFPALLDNNAEVFVRYQAWSLPSTFLINRRGNIVGKIIGYRDWHSDQSKAVFAELLKGTV